MTDSAVKTAARLAAVRGYEDALLMRIRAAIRRVEAGPLDGPSLWAFDRALWSHDVDVLDLEATGRGALVRHRVSPGLGPEAAEGLVTALLSDDLDEAGAALKAASRVLVRLDVEISAARVVELRKVVVRARELLPGVDAARKLRLDERAEHEALFEALVVDARARGEFHERPVDAVRELLKPRVGRLKSVSATKVYGLAWQLGVFTDLEYEFHMRPLRGALRFGP